jgi:acetyl-CoA synthetase
MPDFAAEYQRSVDDADNFWAGVAKELEWSRPWSKVFEWTYPTFRWFCGAQCNITHNCLDRNVRNGRKNKIAYIWAGEDGAERQITYGQLLDLVCRVANGLKSLGVKKGDRVVLYVPLTLEGVAAMLACARIGAVHSVVYAGFSVQALKSRIEDAHAEIIVTADVGYRRGKLVPLKSIVDGAIDGLDFVRTIVVLRRQNRGTEL